MPSQRQRTAELEAKVAQQDAELARLRASETRWRSWFEQMREGFVLGEVVRDAEGQDVDWRYLAVNAARFANWCRVLSVYGWTI